MKDSKENISLLEPASVPAQNYIDAFIAMQERVSKVTESISKSLEVAQIVSDKISPILEGVGNAIIQANQFADVMQPMLDIMGQLSASLIQTIENIRIPILSEDEKRQILKSHQQWGRFGWTWLPAAPLKFYDNPPSDYNDANVKAKNYCSHVELERVFQSLRTYKLRKDDLESAIFCFQNKQYKPCALLLFGLIEAKLIRKQTKDWRDVGIRAVKELQKQQSASDETKLFFTMLHYANLIACLETIFASAQNFKNEPVVINRNFVDHGMSNRRVRKRDCVQLFFVLQNLLLMMEKKI